jgi:hypothetical protein
MWRTLVWSKALKARRLRGPSHHGSQRLWRGASASATKSRLSGWLEESLNVKKAQAPETANGCTRGGKLWRANPMSGSGMKQGQQARGG